MKIVLPPITYSQVRNAWCLAELLWFLERWAVYIVVGLMVLGSGASAGLSGMAGLLAWAVYPLLWAGAQPLAISLTTTLIHSLLGAAVLVALRPLLWSRAWAASENALPLRRAVLLRSDLHITLLALTPVAAVYTIGVATWLASGAPWVTLIRWLALGMVVASLAGSVVWGMALLHFMRWPVGWMFQIGARAAKPAQALPTLAKMHSLRCQSSLKALVLLPLVRGPATRISRIAWTGGAAGIACSLAMLHWPGEIGWPLAAYAALSLAITTRLCGLINRDLAPLHDACAALPVPLARLLRFRQVLAGLPHALALLTVAATGWWMRADIHSVPLLGYLFTNLVFHSLLVFKTLKRCGAQASDDVAWWLLMLVIVVAFASEVGL